MRWGRFRSAISDCESDRKSTFEERKWPFIRESLDRELGALQFGSCSLKVSESGEIG